MSDLRNPLNCIVLLPASITTRTAFYSVKGLCVETLSFLGAQVNYHQILEGKVKENQINPVKFLRISFWLFATYVSLKYSRNQKSRKRVSWATAKQSFSEPHNLKYFTADLLCIKCPLKIRVLTCCWLFSKTEK